MWLTFATFVGYAVVYTVMLKPARRRTSSSAAPRAHAAGAGLGRHDGVGAEALILFLIIFLWTPPHFWPWPCTAWRDYRQSGLPMLPVTHGSEYTRLQVFLYTLILFAGCLMPFVYGMSSWIYLAAAVLLGTGFACAGCLAVARLFGCAGAQDLPFLLVHLEPAVCSCAAGGSLCVLISNHVET